MIVALGSAVVVLLVCWRMRPLLAARALAQRKPPRRSMQIVLASATAAIVVVTAPVVGLATVFGVVLWRRASAARGAARVTRQIAVDYPDVLDLLVLSIRAGYLPAQAIAEISRFLPASVRAAFTAVDSEMQRGVRFGDALNELQTQLGPIAQPMVDSLSSADRYGLPLAPVLERLASEARQQRRRESDAAARELPVRLAIPLVLCTLPSFVLLAIVPLLLGALSSLHT
jgi:Flp pilus assembly protein TadB